MDANPPRRYSAGSPVDDYCRPCRMERRHTVQVANPEGLPLRVICDHCGSQHNFRGGSAPRAPTGGRASVSEREIPLVAERELLEQPTDEGSTQMSQDLERMLRRIIREETGLTPVAPADKWRDGHLVLRPGREELQEKSIPIETFFQKIVGVRNRLRVLEQQVNGADVPQALKIKLQGYVTACYGSLTSFNVLFADDEDRFKGSKSS